MKDDWKNGRGLKEEHKYKILKLKESACEYQEGI